jgi:small subunit ribosomal protein S20
MLFKEVHIVPNIKSAKKRVKVAATKTLQNQMFKSSLKTSIKNFDSAVSENANVDDAYRNAVKKLDKAVAKGIMHKNTAARRKSQITLKANAVKA